MFNGFIENRASMMFDFDFNSIKSISQNIYLKKINKIFIRKIKNPKGLIHIGSPTTNKQQKQKTLNGKYVCFFSNSNIYFVDLTLPPIAIMKMKLRKI